MNRYTFRAACCAAAVLCVSTPVHALDFSLFGDINIDSGDRDDDISTFRIGKFDLFVNQDVDERSRVNAEVIFEDTGHGFETDIERFSVTRTVSDSFNIGAGRYHTPIGFWNHNFHHGIIVQDTVSRPFFLEPDEAHEGLVPTHFVGLMINGSPAFESVTLTYHLAIANNPSIDTSLRDEDEDDPSLEVNNYRDKASDKALIARLGFAPTEGNWALGVSAMRNEITESGEPVADPAAAPYLDEGAVLFKQQIVAFDVRYTTDRFYAIAEYFKLRVSDNANFNTLRATSNPDTYTGSAQYVQLGYSVSDKVGLAVRSEEIKHDDNATYFDLLEFEAQKRTVYALRYNLSDSNVLRFQMTKGKHDDDPYTQYTAQWFFMLF